MTPASCGCEPQRIPDGCLICRDDIVIGFDPDYMLRGAFYAHLDSYDGAEDASWQPIGHGNTRQAAFRDLLETIEGNS